MKCRRMPPCAGAPAKSDARCYFNVLTQTLEGSFSSSRYFGVKIRGSAVNGTEPTGGMKSRNSPLQNNPTIGLVQPSHPCETHPVICPPPTLRHGSCLRSNPGFFSDLMCYFQDLYRQRHLQADLRRRICGYVTE